MIIQKADSSDHEVLTAITKKSKAYWGYSDEQIEIWSEFLTVTKEYIETNSVYKLVLENHIIGYYSFVYQDKTTVKLDNLFILPTYIGKGFGKKLMNDFLRILKSQPINKIVLNAEPNAALFYTKFGFVKIGQIETSIKDRFLPIMQLQLNENRI
ncbi:GNAT family N-acetyltransferase [Flavobacterium sp. MR2016-29]|uniref:GNAT family N-acetyltransferase n=1 Tax=Flavobacterium sp. MR2016-29 TaxID=2783795 RepID=UPI00188CB7E8|nr:GNAT family N-acetyltransferase [Flavobacterium sp. MR2016-29]MBF4491015.1 GNAT family N-acetyltransferase [Flavobacterium sp. MR2016-29]